MPLLRHAYRVGQTTRVRVATTLTGTQTEEGQLTGLTSPPFWAAILASRVVALEPDGCAHVVSTTVPDYPDPRATEGALAGQHQVAYALVDPLGYARQYSTLTSPSMHVLPEHEVEPGDRWSQVIAMPITPAGNEAVLEVACEYEEDRVEDGRTLAIIRMTAPATEWTVTMPQTQEPLHVYLELRGQIWFDAEKGLAPFKELETTSGPVGSAVHATTHTTHTLIAHGYFSAGQGWTYPGCEH